VEFLNNWKPSAKKRKALTFKVKTSTKNVLIQDSNVAAFESFAFSRRSLFFAFVAKKMQHLVRKVQHLL